MVRPGGPQEVAEVVRLARAHQVGLVPQGGNTGLVGGGVPLDGGVVVDLRRLDDVRDLDPISGQLTAGAGAVVSTVQAAARTIGWDYGVDWAARESATVGGSIATNAGGSRFVRHGGTRQQLLGVEATLGTGEMVSHLPRVTKDNTGYDLAGLLCGSEGTLGLVTAARLRLVRPPREREVALVGLESVDRVVSAASALRRSVTIEALELMLPPGMELVSRELGVSTLPIRSSPAYLLVEIEADGSGAVLASAVAALDGVVDAAFGIDRATRERLWSYRESHTLAIARLGPAHKLDVTVPAEALASFADEVVRRIEAVEPDASVWLFGHVGDGNVHVNVTGVPPDAWHIDELVLNLVASAGGSISAEHGVGRAKKSFLHLARTPAELTSMRLIKQALDPAGICNPGVLLPEG